MNPAVVATVVAGLCRLFSKKVRVVEVEKVVEVIRDISEDGFNVAQAKLAAIMNAGLGSVQRCGVEGMFVGPSGCGKSTTGKKFKNANFKAALSAKDVTKELVVDEGGQWVDTCGFNLTMLNIGKMFVVFFIRGLFPQYLLHPCPSGRISDFEILALFVREGLLKFSIIPFDASTYHSMYKELLKGANDLFEGPPRPINEAKVERKAFESALKRGDIISEQKEFLSAHGCNGHTVVYDPNEDGHDLPRPIGSMRDVFINLFFDGNAFRSVTYAEHCRALEQLDSRAILRGMMIGAVNELPKFANINEAGLVTEINECRFFKG